LLNTTDLLFIDGGVLKATIEKDVATEPTFTAKTYTVQRPLLSEINDINLEFNAVIQNYQSPLNPTAAAANSFTAVANAAGLAGTREFLTFKKSYTGPGTLNDNFTVDSKIAIEIGTDTDSQTGLQVVSNLATTNAKSYPRYRQLAAFDDNIIGLGTQFVLPITSLTAAGDYVLTLKVGVVSTTITVNTESAKFKIGVKVGTGTATATASITINGITRTISNTTSSYVYSSEFTLTQGSYNSTNLSLTVAPASGSAVGDLIIQFVP
jgi:hypothetical protein